MKTINIIATVSTFASTATTKIKKFGKNIWSTVSDESFWDEVASACEEIATKTVKKTFQVGVEIGRLVNAAINLAVKLSIIAIALIMVCQFVQQNPAEWNMIVSTASETWTSLSNQAIQACENIWSALTAPARVLCEFAQNIFA